MTSSVVNLPHALGTPPGKGSLKCSPEDFIVEEILGFECSGAGEHVFLHIEKRDENTEYIARLLARFVGIPLKEVGYAGLKDRHGITRQWFSVKAPVKAEPDFSPLESAHLKILATTRNARKLKKGAARGNRFDITLRHWRGEKSLLEHRLSQISSMGVPNYFGSQRFGHDGGNLDQALALFAGELERVNAHQRGLYLSAARSEIFNRVLAVRVEQGNWNQALPGDVYMFPDSHSFFRADRCEDILHRLALGKIHPSGPLWGRGENPASDVVRALETAVALELQSLSRGVEGQGLEMARRPLRLWPEDLSGEWISPDSLNLRFSLPAGAYATTLIRELMTEETAQSPQADPVLSFQGY